MYKLKIYWQGILTLTYFINVLYDPCKNSTQNSFKNNRTLNADFRSIQVSFKGILLRGVLRGF